MSDTNKTDLQKYVESVQDYANNPELSPKEREECILELISFLDEL